MPLTYELHVARETWPLKEPFVISRGTKTAAAVVVVTVRAGQFEGRGECVPYARYAETVDSVVAQLDSCRAVASRAELQSVLPHGAARNALDCALWDLEAKASGMPAYVLAGLPAPRPVETCYTLSLAAPDAMAAKARAVPHLKLLKLKLGGDGDPERMAAVRAARPDARLVADANEAWTPAQLAPFLAAAAAAGFELIEQPLPAGDDAMLEVVNRPVPVCADESLHTGADLPAVARRYDAVNIKLDKAGGLTEALLLKREAEALGLQIMVGCMVATSLAMAPAILTAQGARWIDLDGPLLLARDRPHALLIENGIIAPPSRALWG